MLRGEGEIDRGTWAGITRGYTRISPVGLLLLPQRGERSLPVSPLFA